MIPSGLKDPLLKEYEEILTNYAEQKWRAAELSGGRFCEIVYTILEGTAAGSYSPSPSKPANFLRACQLLESQTSLDRGLRILVARLLPALYEIRNNRNVGHVGGIDPDEMDSKIVVEITSWVMAELVRCFHNINTSEAQDVVNKLVTVKSPLLWSFGDKKRILDPKMSMPDKVLLLLAAEGDECSISSLMEWMKYSNRTYLIKVLKSMDKECLIDLDDTNEKVCILPPGSQKLSENIGRTRR